MTTTTATPAPTATTAPTTDASQTPAPRAALVPPVIASAAVAGGALLVDVRSDGYRERLGGLPQAVVVAKPEVGTLFDLDSPDHLEQVDSTTAPIVVICGSVAGSTPVVEELLELGYTGVVHVDGGYPAWKAAGLPVTPGTEDTPVDAPSQDPA